MRSKRSALRSALSLLFALVLLSAALVVLYSSVVRPPQGRVAIPPVPQGTDWYQIYFTSPLYPDAQSRHSGSLDERLTAFIDTSKRTVDAAIYQMDLSNVTDALLRAKDRGVTVRVVTSTDTMDDPLESGSFRQLQSAGIQVVAGNPNGIMHDKFVVLDGVAVWTGSWNFTDNDTYRYNNNAVLVESQELARNYTVVFEKMWRDKQFGRQKKLGGTTPRLTIEGVSVESYFSPEDGVAQKVVARLRAAQSSIDFMAYSFTSDQIGSAVKERAKAGVKVRGVFERSGSETQYSEFGSMRSEGLDVVQDGNPSLMHHKVIVIDGRTVITGSFNFSGNADITNDENLLIVDDSAMAAPFTAEFERVLARAKNPATK